MDTAQKSTTPLSAWLRAATKDERKRAADLAETTVNYLFQLAGCHRPKPSSDLAFRIEDATRQMHVSTGGRLPVITARELSTMCACVATA